MANKLAESAVAGVETFGGLVQRTVGKAIGSERLQEMGQGLLDHADALRNRGADPADEPTVDEPANEPTANEPAAEATPAEAPSEARSKAPSEATPSKPATKAQVAKQKRQVRARQAQEADATARASQTGTGHPPSLHRKASPRRQHQL